MFLQEVHVSVKGSVGGAEDPHRLHPSPSLGHIVHMHVLKATQPIVLVFSEISIKEKKERLNKTKLSHINVKQERQWRSAHPASRNIKYRKFHVEQFSTGQKIKNLMPQKGQSLVNQT